MPETIVALHGFTQTGASWAPVIAELGERYRGARVLAPDVRGHGMAAARRPVDVAGCVEDVAVLAPPRFVLAGYSMGGRLALHVALALPGRVAGLVLVGATAGIADPDERAARRAADAALADRLEREPIEEFARRWGAQPLFAGQSPEIAAAAHADRLRNTTSGLAAALRGIGTGVMAPVWGRLGELAMPVRVLASERDDKFRAIGADLADAIPRARLAIVPGAGHAAHLEQPVAVADEVAAAARLPSRAQATPTGARARAGRLRGSSRHRIPGVEGRGLASVSKAAERGDAMATGEKVQTAVGAHLVGGLKAPDAETAMRKAGCILGRHLHALPDGETGERNQWIGWQLGKLTAIDGIEMAGMKAMPSDSAQYAEMPALAVDASVTELPARSLGYADAAEASYPIFRRLRDEGEIPQGVKFQVSVPTPYATVVAWVRPEDHERFFPVYARAIADEVSEIVGVVGCGDLVLQYDVAVEIAALTGDFAAGGQLAEKRFIVDALRDALAGPPDSVERGLHLCYGDYGHRHFTVPDDLSLCVELANEAGARADFIHMPADRETGRDPRYFEPLRDLVTRRLALGVIDYEGDEQRTRELVEAATTGSGGMPFAVATECGMARIDERGPDSPTLERLLELHARTAAPIR